MRNINEKSRNLFIASLALAVSACSGGEAEDDALTETELGNIDVQEGTISDDMIQTDTSSAAATEAAEADAESQQKNGPSESQAPTPEASEEEETTVEAGEVDE